MNSDNLRDIQLAQLKIAKKLKDVCDKNGIKYFMDSGTLLGAVRHKGFIPWDDDMDFGLLRPEYEKLCSLPVSEWGDNYFFQTWKTDKGYPFSYAKLLLLNTEYIELAAAESNKRKEVFIDVFVYDKYPDDIKNRKYQGRRIHFWRHISLMKCGYKMWTTQKTKKQRFYAYIKYMPFRVLSKIISKNTIIKNYEDARKKFNNQKGLKYLYNAGSGNYGRQVITNKCVDGFVDLPFEDTVFSAPIGYKEYLHDVYGNYMELPPLNERGNQHSIVSFKL